eukprot:scaffold22290_cov101-Isochrysis_galbana.AAC.4
MDFCEDGRFRANHGSSRTLDAAGACTRVCECAQALRWLCRRHHLRVYPLVAHWCHSDAIAGYRRTVRLVGLCGQRHRHRPGGARPEGLRPALAAGVYCAVCIAQEARLGPQCTDGPAATSGVARDSLFALEPFHVDARVHLRVAQAADALVQVQPAHGHLDAPAHLDRVADPDRQSVDEPPTTSARALFLSLSPSLARAGKHSHHLQAKRVHELAQQQLTA